MFWMLAAFVYSRGYTLPVYPGRVFESDPNGDDLTKPCLVVDCTDCPVNQELHDPAVYEAKIAISLFRDGRAETLEELDGLLQEIHEFLIDEQTLATIEFDESAPHHGEFIAHEFELPEILFAPDGETDVDLLQTTMHCQHFFYETVEAVEPPDPVISFPPGPG